MMCTELKMIKEEQQDEYWKIIADIVQLFQSFNISLSSKLHEN